MNLIKKKLFGKFARLTPQPTGEELSTGLGLFIVKKLVDAMNGSVLCESELGKGTIFRITFPITEGND
ncbi:response regulator receiver protein [Beggiatoa sp. PS]|nr:response regulator receiver protein [Beggiatoa sp. PS]